MQMRSYEVVDNVESRIIVAIAEEMGMTIDEVEACGMEVEDCSSNYNNHSYCVWLPNGWVASVWHEGPGGFEMDPQEYQIDDAWEVALQSEGFFVHPDIREEWDCPEMDEEEEEIVWQEQKDMFRESPVAAG